MKLAPPEFDGPFSEFFNIYVLPNLPTIERLKEFDLRLRRYLEGPAPVHPVRKVAGQKRGAICETECGGRMLPTDNAPVWWIHAFISSNDAFPIENDLFFKNLPSHMFQLSKRKANLNSAGFHAAHIVAAKNRNTAWRAWDQAELRRRTLVNIHPCNMFLISKTDWRVWGGDAVETAIGRLQDHPGKRLDQLVSTFPAQNPNQGMIYRRQAIALTYKLAVSEATEEHDRSRLKVPTNRKTTKLLEVNDPVSPTDALTQ